MLNQALSFGPFRLDPRAGLARGRHAVRLTPRAFSLLCFLAAQRGRVVGKEELFQAVWRGAPVGDAALVTCVQELRRALRDKAASPRYIETLHRRGYRFIGAEGPVPPADLPQAALDEAAVFVGRQRELQMLEQALAAACGGRRQVVLVAGEAGIGKTSLVRALLSRAAGVAPIQLAWGQSAEHYGASEPYHPILDALTRACRASAGEALLEALEAHAPLWLAQLPSLVPAARLRSVQRRAAGASPERMQRQLTEALERAALARPLVLWLEDLHWSDAPTIDWLAAFARRPEPARVLVLGTYRAVEARAERHALYVLHDELARHGHSRTLSLGRLDAAAVGEYVAATYPARADAAPALARLATEIHGRTEGSPLFMVGMLNELVSRGVLLGEQGTWSLRGAASATDLDIPPLLREMIERQIERLDAAALRLLEAASVAGLRFAAASVSAALDRPVAEVERALDEIAREQPLIAAAGREEWPDGTVSSRFSFAHALYREALYARLSAAQGVQVHRRIAERLAAGYRRHADEVAAQVAMLFERGRDTAAALEWLRKAGDAAMRRKAAREAAAHYEHALELLAALQPARARGEAKAALRLALCAPLVAVHGMGSPRVQACASEALRACAALGDQRGRFMAHRVLWNHSLMRLPSSIALRHARELMQAAKAAGNPVELALAHRALGSSLIYVGDLRGADRLLQRGVAISDRVPDAQFERYGEHPGMVCRAFRAWPRAFMGFAASALELSEASIRHARRRDEPHGLAFALVTAGLVYLFLRDVPRAAAIAAEVQALSAQYELAQWIAFAHELRGWVAFQRGERAQGIELMRQGLERLHGTGARTHSSRLLANLAESCLIDERVPEARRYIDAAFAHRAQHGEQYYAPELYRIDALVLRAEGAAPARVRAALRRAIVIARRQRAALFEKRAAAIDL